MTKKEREKILKVLIDIDECNFEGTALRIFQYQYGLNPIYKQWVDTLGIDVSQVQQLDDIPFLPIHAYKCHQIVSGASNDYTVFESSGTTGSTPSRHFVQDISLYLDNTVRIFGQFYGEVADYCYLALLPNYLERQSSSLVAMVDHFISRSVFDQSGFYLYDHERLFQQLEDNRALGIPTVLFGVSFALLDFLDLFTMDYPELIIIETGGMKGRKKEMTKRELQAILATGFGVESVHSEYGMTELLSQAYSLANGLFVPGNTMKIVVRDLTDPLSEVSNGKTGVLNIIDLANIDSCAFIETQDLGISYDDGTFRIMGRVEVADIRGCNLMVADL